MEKSWSTRRLWILVTVLAVISISSIYWNFLELKYRKLDEKMLAKHQSTIQSLQLQLSAQKQINKQLSENYRQTENDKKNTMTELQDLIAMDWENKYKTMKNKNDILLSENTALKNQYDNEIARLDRAQKFLASENNSLKKSAFEQSAINDKNLKTIAGLETEIKQNKKTIAKLKKPPEKAPTAKAEVTTKPVEIKTENIKPGKKSAAYRHVRLQSLSNAMTNQDSEIRKNILVSVIPTIPEGISDNELLTLVDGMQSGDILAVIQHTNQYINRPLDNQTINTLVGLMNELDAQTAESIFFNAKNSNK